MAIRRAAAPAALDERTTDLLLHGPWRIGLDLLTMPDHGTLRALWHAHEATLMAEAARRGIAEPWFVGRDWWLKHWG